MEDDKSTKTLSDILNRDWERLRDQRYRKNGGWESQALMSIAFVRGQQEAFYEGGILGCAAPDDNNPSIIYNKLDRNVRRIDGKLHSVIPEFHAIPGTDDPVAVATAKVTSRMVPALDEELGEVQLGRQRRRWLIETGIAYEYVTYERDGLFESQPKMDEETGEPVWTLVGADEMEDAPEMSEEEVVELVQTGQATPEQFEIKMINQPTGRIVDTVLSPFNVFVDSAVECISKLPSDQWVHIVRPKTLEWVRKQTQWEGSQDPLLSTSSDMSVIRSKIKQQGVSATGFNLHDILPMVQGYQDPDGPDMLLIGESYQPPSKEHPEGRFIVWAPGQKTILHDGEIPYSKYDNDYQIPLVDFHASPVTTSHHTFGLVAAAIPAQIVLNKRASQAAKYVNGNLCSPMLFDSEKLMESWAPDTPHGIPNAFGPDGRPLVSRVPSDQPPQLLLMLLESADQKIDEIMGIRDLYESNQLPGQVRGTHAFERIEEIQGLEWAPMIHDYVSCLSRVITKRINRVREFYDEDRTFTFVSQTGEDEVVEWRRDDHRQWEHRISFAPSSLTPQIRSMREDRIIQIVNTPGLGMAVYGNADQTALDPSKLAHAMGMPEGTYKERAAQERTLQDQECEDLDRGLEVPVWPDDDDAAHLEIIKSRTTDLGWRKQNPPDSPVFNAYMAHKQQHSEQLSQKQEAQRAEAVAMDAQAMINQSMAQMVPQVTQKATEMALESIQQTIQGQPGGAVQLIEALSQQAGGGNEEF